MVNTISQRSSGARRIGVVSSRLGRPIERWHPWFYRLERVLQRAKESQGILGTAPLAFCGPWVSHGACLYKIPLLDVVNQTFHNYRDDLRNYSRRNLPADQEDDSAIIEWAETVYVLRVRRRGKIFQLVADALKRGREGIWVGVYGDKEDGSLDLVEQGAVGWYLCSPQLSVFEEQRAVDENFSFAEIQSQPDSLDSPNFSKDVESFMAEQSGEWLIHSTRARSGPFPDQSELTWRDSVLLRHADGLAAEPAEVLQRIIRQRVLRGQRLSKGQPPVVCFTALPLTDWLARRTFRAHRGRWDSEPFGIAIRRRAIENLGGRAVVYDDCRGSVAVAEDERWCLQSPGKTYDWRTEQEWRLRGDLHLDDCDPDSVRVFVQGEWWQRLLQKTSPWPVIDVGQFAYNAKQMPDPSQAHSFGASS